MLCVATHRPLKPPPSQKMKTWKFAAKFVWKNNFVKDKAELGSWTRDQLLELGPTFVKLGQIASTRADLYPREYWTGTSRKTEKRERCHRQSQTT